MSDIVPIQLDFASKEPRFCYFSPNNIQIYPPLQNGSPDLTCPILSRELMPHPLIRKGGATVCVVEGCNLSCQYCIIGQVPKKALKLMTVDIGQAVVDYLCTAFIRKVDKFSLSFTSNGEPSLNLPVIKAIIDYCKQRERQAFVPIFSFNFATNCTILNNEEVEELARIPELNVIFSIDGPENVHNMYRTQSCANNYKRVIRCVETYHRHRLSNKYLISSTVLTAAYNAFDEILIHLDSLGFDCIVMRPVRGMIQADFGLNERTLPLYYIEGYQRIVYLLEQRIRRGDFSLLLKICNKYDFFGRLLRAVWLREPRSQGCPRCPAVYDDISHYTLVFDVNGDVFFPCRDFVGLDAYKIGNVLNQVDLTKLRMIMNRVDTNCRIACKECWARKICGGHCYSAALLSTGDIQQPDKNLCILTRYLAAQAVRMAYLIAQTGVDLQLE